MTLQINQIIFINEYPYLYGGTEHYVNQVAGELKKRGIETILFYEGIVGLRVIDTCHQ